MELYEKLVRDKIPEIIAQEGKYPVVRTLNNGEYKEELLKKLVEEAGEARGTKDDADALIKELADVREVYLAILGTFGVSEAQVEEARIQKKTSRGGFEKKIFLESVSNEGGEK